MFTKDIIWEMPNSNKIFLSFDDGPNPESTPQLLQLLDSFGIKATFFCLGEKIVAYPEIYNDIIKRGHVVGNHGFYHLSGWKTNTKKYIENIRKSSLLLKNNLFRPPYGKLTLSQFLSIKNEFKIIMWSYMPGDFDSKQSIQNIIKMGKLNYRPGSIIVLHDTPTCLVKIKAYLQELSFKNKAFGSLKNLTT